MNLVIPFGGCRDGKTISATFYADSVGLMLSDGRSLQVPQTMSGSGARYANADESFVSGTKVMPPSSRKAVAKKPTLIASLPNERRSFMEMRPTSPARRFGYFGSLSARISIL